MAGRPNNSNRSRQLGPRDRTPQQKHRINEDIRAREVRIVGLEEEEKNGVYTVEEALRLAETYELDLVEVAPQIEPPVCKIIDYSKFLYDLKKREKVQKQSQQANQMKEIRFGPNTDDHDFNFKLRHAQKFLQEGNKVKVYVQFRGRNIIYNERGRELLTNFANELTQDAKVELEPKLEGRRMNMILAPAKAAAKK